MTRTKGPNRTDLGLEDDHPYRGILHKPAEGWLQLGDPKYGDAKRLVVEWEISNGKTVRDWMSQSVGMTAANKPSKLRQLLNALAENPTDAELWWDPDSLEWGYDLERDDSPAYAQLAEGMAVVFKGENRKNQKGQPTYRITGYKSAAKSK